jgi:hypothetical protein
MREGSDPMTLTLDEATVRERLRPLLDVEAIRRSLHNIANDPFLLSIFLMGVSQGEALGEVGVATIRQEEIAGLIHELRRQELEEHGHHAGTRLVVEELFPELFDGGGRFRYHDALNAAQYYFRVRDANRAHLRERGVYSRVNLYLTTTFGYEVLVQLLYNAAIETLRRSTLPAAMTERVIMVLTMILRQEETHLETIAQHNALLAAPRGTLSADACALLDALARLSAEDYEWAAELAVREIVPTMQAYADPVALRARIGA